MSEKNVLILQSEVVLKDYKMNELYDTILAQKERGVILLPSYVKVVNVPEEAINGELIVMNSGAPEPEKKPKWYLIKDPRGKYLKNVNRNLNILEFTDCRYYAQPFDKESADKIIKNHLDSGYTLEEL